MVMDACVRLVSENKLGIVFLLMCLHLHVHPIVLLMVINVSVMLVSLKYLQEFVEPVHPYNFGMDRNVLQAKYVYLALSGMLKQIAVCFKHKNVVLMHLSMDLGVNVRMDTTLSIVDVRNVHQKQVSTVFSAL